MMVFRRSEREGGAAFTFRVSDVVAIPLRGTMLRLRVADGQPSMADLGVGARLRLRSPAGEEREVRIADHVVTGGRPTQERLDRARELDVLIADGAGTSIEIGWLATGPVD